MTLVERLAYKAGYYTTRTQCVVEEHQLVKAYHLGCTDGDKDHQMAKRVKALQQQLRDLKQARA